MRIHAKKIDYDMICCCATFISSLQHDLVWADDSVMKIALFMKYRDRTFEKGNKKNQILRNIFVAEEINSNVDTDDDVPLSILISNKKESSKTVTIKKRNQSSISINNTKKRKLNVNKDRVTLLQLEKFYGMEIIQVDPLKCDTLLDVFKKGWEKDNETDELVLYPGSN